MQLVKVVIASALVLVACAEGLPEGKDCILKCTTGVTIQTDFAGCIAVCSYIMYVV